jgi:transcriptional antiterminator NusG
MDKMDEERVEAETPLEQVEQDSPISSDEVVQGEIAETTSGDEAAMNFMESEASTADQVLEKDEEDSTEEMAPVEDDTSEEESSLQVADAEMEMVAEEPVSEADLLSAEVDDETPAEVAEVAAEEAVSDEIEEVQLEEGEESLAESPDLEVATESEPAVVEEITDDRLWYVVHCYSGYENKVRHNLEQRIETMGMKAKIFDVVVPTEEEIEIRDGKRRTVERRVFPGYILVQMIMDEDSWYVVRNTPGVTGFVGMGNEPTPLRPEEVTQIVKRMEADAPRIKVTYKQGQKVRIIDGPFNDFIGTVADIDIERAKVRVMVSFFGRETPVELDFLQVEKA